MTIIAICQGPIAKKVNNDNISYDLMDNKGTKKKLF